MSYNYLSYANMPYWDILPCGISNFGGDTQVFTLPDDITSGPVGMMLNEPALALLKQQQNIYNNWGAATSPIGTTGGVGVTGASTGNIFIDNMINIGNRMTTQATQRRLTGVLTGLGKLREQLYAQLYKPGITDEDAAKINDYITKLNEEEQKLTQAAEEANNGNMQLGDLTKVVAEAESTVQNITGEIRIGQNIKAFLKNMEKTFEKIANIEKRTDLTAPAKERLAQLKSQLEKIKENLEKLQKNPDKLEPAKVNAELTKICAEYNGILSAINQISTSSTTPASTDPTAPTSPSGATSPTTPGSTDPTTPTTPSTPSTPTTPSTPGSTDPTTPTTPSTPATPTAAGYSAEGRQIVDMFDDGDLEDACKKINSGNVMDVMLAWQDLYSAEYDKTFMERFVSKAGYSDKRKYGKLIMNALRDKVLELGIMDKCREDFAKINKEVKSTFWFDNDVSENYDNIIKEIAKKEGKKYVEKPAK